MSGFSKTITTQRKQQKKSLQIDQMEPIHRDFLLKSLIHNFIKAFCAAQNDYFCPSRDYWQTCYLQF